MGSRIMHYCISSLLADKLNISNKDEFMLGGIAPDIHGLMGVAKGLTHFKDIEEQGKNHINYKRFYTTYRETMDSPFYLGYLCHLISDAVWLEFYFNLVHYESKEQWQETLELSYSDFEKLNGRIIEQYSLVRRQHTIPDITIQNYDVNQLPVLVDLLYRDFLVGDQSKQEPLQLFKDDNSEIIGYINDSVERCLNFIYTTVE